MHHIHHTEGIILSSRNYGEAGKYYRILTRELGLVVASASGVRKMESKLRYVLQDFCIVRVDLVRGRDFWRVTSASKAGKLEHLARNPAALAVFARIARLTRRLLAGEEANEALYDDLAGGLAVLEQADAPADLANMEAVIVLRMLASLGYIGAAEELRSVISSPFGAELALEASRRRPKMLSEINRAIRESHL